MRKVAFTGHRPNKLSNDYELTSPLVLDIQRKIIDYLKIEEKFYNYQYWGVSSDIEFITGMALGIDQLAAKIAIFYNIPFTAAIPCRSQEGMWPTASKQRYHDMLSKAKEVYQVSNEPYSPWLMQKRNEWMVDNCTELLAVWDGSSGGTANCIRYAEKIHKPIHIIRI